MNEREKLLAHMDAKRDSVLFTPEWFDKMQELYNDLRCVAGIIPEVAMAEILEEEYDIRLDKSFELVEWIKL
jgi:hypothetical protein